MPSCLEAILAGAVAPLPRAEAPLVHAAKRLVEG